VPFDPEEGADQARFYGAKYTSKSEETTELRTTDGAVDDQQRSASGTLQWMRGRCLGLPLGVSGMMGFAVVTSTRSVKYYSEATGGQAKVRILFQSAINMRIAKCSEIQ
jgi:hypothetical protein